MKYTQEATRQTSVSYFICAESTTTMHVWHNHAEKWLGVGRKKKELTSSSFSGRPFNPPLGSCRSDNHQARVSTSTTSNRSRMARAATHTNTVCVWWFSIDNRTIEDMTETLAYLAQRGSQHQHYFQTLHHNFCTAQYTLLPCPCSSHPVDLTGTERWQHNTEIACLFPQRRLLQIHRRVVEVIVWLVVCVLCRIRF